MRFLIKSQHDADEEARRKRGAVLDSCGPSAIASAVSWASGYKVDFSAADGVAAAKKAFGYVDRQGVLDGGTSLSQLALTARAMGAKARWAKSWKDAVTEARNGAALGIHVQAGPWYPSQVKSAWHLGWERYWAKRDPAHLKKGYGHMTAAGFDPDSAQFVFADPTMSGKGAEQYARPVSERELMAIASTKGDKVDGKPAPWKRILIITHPARGEVFPTPDPVPTPLLPKAPEVQPPSPAPSIPVLPDFRHSEPSSPTATPPTPASAPTRARKPVAARSEVQEVLSAFGRVPLGQRLEDGLGLLARGRAATKGRNAMDKVKWVIANTGIDEAILECLRVGVSTALAVALGLGIPILDFAAGDFRVVASAGLAAMLQVLVRALNPDDPKFGVGAAKAARAAEKAAVEGKRAR